jgi:phenylacetate-coenzyme A ligase PaaK-like adenylate-forming protein
MPGPEVRLAAEIDGAAADTLQQLASALRASLGVRIDVAAVPPGSLPRFEHKARRVVRSD